GERPNSILVVDGQETGVVYENIPARSVVFNRDGSRFAYVAQKQQDALVVVINDQESKPYSTCSGMLFSPDGRRTAFTATTDRRERVVVVDGKEEKASFQVFPESLVFSPDSRHVAYLADQRGKTLTVVDGVETDGDQPEEPKSLVFDGPATL